MALEEKQGEQTPQLAFRWKPGYREIWQPALDAWAQGQPKGQQSAQDYIMHLIRMAERTDDSASLRERLDVLGLKVLADAHYARRSAEDNMLATVADLIAGARATAEAEVRTELERLKRQIDFAQEAAKKAEDESSQLKEKAAALSADLDSANARAEAAEEQTASLRAAFVTLEDKAASADEQAKQLAEELAASRAETLKERDARVTALEAATKELETARAEIHALKEQKLQADKSLAEMQLALETVSAKAAAELEKAQERLREREKELDDLGKDLETEKERSEKAMGELMEARLRIAALEGEAKAKSEQSSALNDALAAMTAIAQSSHSKSEPKEA